MRTKYKKLFGILLSLVLVVGMLPAISMTVHADQPAVKYLDENGEEKSCTDYTVVTESMGTTWDAGWYYVNANVTFNSQIKPSGDVHIILGDNAKMSLNGGFFCGNNLSIYAQSTGENMGILEATPPSDTAIFAAKTITIAGGNIIAKAANTQNGSFGINTSENLIICGGHVIATSEYGHSIFATQDVIIYKGSVEAHGSGTDPNSHGFSGIVAAHDYLEIHGGNLIASSGNGEALWAPDTNGKIINHLPGTGWTDTAGTTGESIIPINEAGDGNLSSYKKVEFLSPTTVKTAPTAKSLTFTGQAQELVTEGKTDCGTILYGLSEDETTEPTSWSESIPTGTDIKTYYVWYYVKGYGLYKDSAKDKVAVTILPQRASEGDGQTVSIGTPATFKFDVNYDDFKDRGAVYVDGKPVDSKHYDAKPGSTVITLKEEFIDSLSEGEHTVTITLAGVSVGDATFNVTKAAPENNEEPAAPADNKSPATGDSISNILLLFLISFMGLAGIGLYTKKKELFR